MADGSRDQTIERIATDGDLHYAGACDLVTRAAFESSTAGGHLEIASGEGSSGTSPPSSPYYALAEER